MDVSVRKDGAKWVVIERAEDGTTSIGGPFDTREHARLVAEGARMMAERLAAKRGGAVSDDDLIERAARAIYETQDNPIPWDSETLGDWRRDYEREKARAALAVYRQRGAV